jgi:hypothetical protein
MVVVADEVDQHVGVDGDHLLATGRRGGWR